MMDFILTKTPLVFLTQSFWRDEAFSYLLSNQSVWQMLVNTAQDFSPPLHPLLLHYWMVIFGSSEIALRSVSLIFFYATIYIVDHLLIDVFKIKTKWRYAYLLLFAINPFLIYFASEARSYSMSVFFVTASWYAYLTGKRKLHIVTSALSLYTHYFTVLGLISQFIYNLLHKRDAKKSVAFLYIAVLFSPWIIFTLINHGFSDGTFWIMKPPLETLWLTPGIILTGFENSLRLYSTPLNVLTLITYGSILIAIKTFLSGGAKRETVTYLLLWSLFPAVVALLVSIVKPVFLPRYFIFSSVGISLLLVFSLERIKPVLRAGIYFLLIALLLQYNAIQITYRTKDDVRSIVNQIRLLATPHDLIYVENELDFHTVQYYYDPSRVFIYRKSYDEIPQFVGKVLIPSSQVVSTLPLFPKKAFVIHNNLTYDVQSMN